MQLHDETIDLLEKFIIDLTETCQRHAPDPNVGIRHVISAICTLLEAHLHSLIQGERCELETVKLLLNGIYERVEARCGGK